MADEEAGLATTYCADTSALIDLRVNWPPESFPSVWVQMDLLVNAARLFSPFPVLEEIRRGDDELRTWADEHPAMFRRMDAALLVKTAEVLRDFPDLVDQRKEHEDADPFVVAAAVLQQEGQADLFSGSVCAVLTQEHRRIGRSRIPHACDHYGIECFDFRELIKREQWKF